MVLVNNGQNLLFVASIHVTTIRGLLDSNVFISDMKMHDVTRDLIMLNQSRICQQELKLFSLQKHFLMDYFLANDWKKLLKNFES